MHRELRKTGRRRPNALRAAAVGAVLVVAAAGCGGKDEYVPPLSGSGTPWSTSPSPTPSPSPTGPPSGSLHIAFDGSFQTERGYGYKLSASLILLPATTSVVNEQPGFATIVREYDPSSYWNLHNLLPDRNAPLDIESVYQLSVHGLFQASRPVCQGIRTQYEIVLNSGGKTCSLRFGYLVRDDRAPRGIEPDGTAAGGFRPSDWRVDAPWTMRKVPEANVAAVMRDLEQGPDSTAVMIENAVTPTGWQTPFEDSFTSACLVEPNGIGSAGMILYFFNGVEASGLSRPTACDG